MTLTTTIVIVALILMVEHWGLTQIAQSRFHEIVRYTLGVLAMIVPLGFLLWSWDSKRELFALIGVVVASGVTVVFSYAADWLADKVREASKEKSLRINAEERERRLVESVHD